MIKTMSVLGSTGSIGVQTLDVAKSLNIKVAAISANSNVELLEKQVREFRPHIVAVADQQCVADLTRRLSDVDIEILSGQQGLKQVATFELSDTVVSSIVGIAGLVPTIEAIRAGKNIIFANKEVLVTAGSIVMPEIEQHNVTLLPADSEHSAIFQCIHNNNKKQISKIIITASGGPFRHRNMGQLKDVTAEQALRHPNWSMGKKITIDSATLMNKGLEVIEAKWLFNIPVDKIDVVVHPQSIIHSMVEYQDGMVMAQMATADMRIPIQYAVTYPDRVSNDYPKLDLIDVAQLTFERPDFETFRCLSLAYQAIKQGGTMPTVLNAANEVAVNLFLNNSIKFLDIPSIIETAMMRHNINYHPTLDDIIETDLKTRQQITSNL